MSTLHRPFARRRPMHGTPAATGVAGLAVVLALSLAACRDDDNVALTPAGAALVASAPAMAAARVPAPPSIQAVLTSQAAPSAVTPASTELASVRARLEDTLNKASTCRVDTDCHSVAVGAKSCGGPTGYRAFSSQGADPAQVTALAQQERDLSATVARESHQVSPCFMLGDPGAHCQQNKCVTGPASPN